MGGRRRVRRLRAAAGTLVFLVVAPGLVAGLGPWWITGWDRGSLFGIAGQVIGGLLVAAGALVLLRAFVRFVVEGLGTPAPVAPTEHLVVGGLYRFVRNPMYIAVVATIVGQAFLLGRPVLLLYAAVIAALQAAFVRWHEEPELSRRFGQEYETYREAVPAWLPRLRPWHADGSPKPLNGSVIRPATEGDSRNP
jgi:protein-S-isoprenylcysteine O-methyltransferase Ste14